MSRKTRASASRSRTSTRCPRYVGRLFRDVTIGPSPLWLKARLLAAGMRPISNVVDVTNYVMLALGNPLHAFDHEKLVGKVIVRRARPGELLVTLDGVERKLEPEDLVIADEAHAVALAGIMGGAETEIAPETTTVLLEAANFEPATIFHTAERLRMSTEGQNRWVKGVDPHLAQPAANLATTLILELTGARWVADKRRARGAADASALSPSTRSMPTRGSGVKTPAGEQRALLERLGFKAKKDSVTAPTWRARDVTREVDAIEEIARFRLEDVPFTLPKRRAMFGRLTREQFLQRRRRGHARRARLRGDVHAVAPPRRPRPERLPAARADLRRASRCCGRRCSRASSTRC